MNQKKECIGQLGIDPPDLNCPHGSEQEPLLFPPETGFALASPNCAFLEKSQVGTHKVCAIFYPGDNITFCEKVPTEIRQEVAELLKNSFLLLTSQALPTNEVQH
ncbi:MAG: hypothetical protein K9L85_04410 [Candidatus Peribacteraceae bacterium]|nr:hypothetical protein [Candidatus Peribacteraceae bacterium]